MINPTLFSTLMEAKLTFIVPVYSWLCDFIDLIPDDILVLKREASFMDSLSIIT